MTKLFKRREWVANVADPTVVVRWRTTGRHVVLELTGSWGVDAKLTILGRTWRTYNHPVFVWLFDRLEAGVA